MSSHLRKLGKENYYLLISMSEKIKIIHVIPTLGFGGAERLVLDLIKNIDREKYDLRMVAMVRGGGMEPAYRDTGVPLEIFYKKGKLGLNVFFKLTKYFKSERPDIVHTHLFGADVWAGLAAHFAKVPHIVKTEHNLNLAEGWFKKLVKKMTAFVFEKMVAISPAVVEYMIDVEKMPKDKIKIIYNGIDVARFSKKDSGNYSEPPRLINVSRLEKQKGHQNLIKALEKIKNIDWQMNFVGDGSLRIELENQVRDAGLSEQIKFLGNCENVPELLLESDIFIFTPLWEGLGLAALEAGAVGLPIIATNVDGIKNIFQDNETAQLVEPKDPEALAKVIAWAIEHQDKARYMGQLAQKMVQEKFSIKLMAQEYEHLYESL
jgi:glycosyltransferase involved in cell wall biosynthesis